MTEERIDTLNQETNGASGQPAADVNGQQPKGDVDVPADVQALQSRVVQLEKESAEHRQNWLRATADYKNFKRRTDQERAELIRSASAGLLLKLLPVIDDLDRALAGVPDEVAATPWFGGVKLIAQKLQTVLDSEGVTAIPALGQEFDPNLHEAVIYEDAADGMEGKVVGELQKGYRLRDRVLRPTMVKVGRHKD